MSEVLTGFNDTYKQLNDDYRNILYLLYSISHRLVMYNSFVGKNNNNFKNSCDVLQKTYSEILLNNKSALSEDEFYELFKDKDLREVTNHCDRLMNNSKDKTTQSYLAFAMIGIFFTDLYLILTKYADDFKESIKYKVNIKIEENQFHENVPAPRIVIKSNVDRRSVSIQLRCNEATAHKMAVLFVKEFDLLMNKFEDYFKLVGLKIYYVLPEVEKDAQQDSLDNYNFEAYIPTLLPLLTGDNIYKSKEVFARELIQNSIDAISVREAKDSNEFSKDIIIELGYDENSKRYFKIIDNGTGMDRYKIERYFTSIGRSFYSGEEYEDLRINYKPISSFGIGFLSSFMVCKEIDVKTRYFTNESEELRLHIPNYDGCFFVEKEKNLNIGTEIKLYLDTALSNEEIIDYIKENLLDIKYNIVLKQVDKMGFRREHKIKSHTVRRFSKSDNPLFFIPLNENYEVVDIDYDTEIMNEKFIEKYEYGILISSGKKIRKLKDSNWILNAGIAVNGASVYSIFEIENNYKNINYNDELKFNSIYVNFPANWVQLDVSREKLTGFTSQIVTINDGNPTSGIKTDIAQVLCKQIESGLQYIKDKDVDEKNISITAMQEVINWGIELCSENLEIDVCRKLVDLRYCVKVIFTTKGVEMKVIHNMNAESLDVISYENSAQKHKEQFIKEFFLKFMDNDMRLRFVTDTRINPRDLFQKNYGLMHSALYLKSVCGEFNLYASGILKSWGIEYENIGDDLNFDLSLCWLLVLNYDNISNNQNKYEILSLVQMLEIILMQKFTVKDVENNCASVEITYAELDKMFIPKQ